MVRVVINGWSSGGSNNSGSGDGGVAIMVVVVVFVCINVYKLIIFRYTYAPLRPIRTPAYSFSGLQYNFFTCSIARTPFPSLFGPHIFLAITSTPCLFGPSVYSDSESNT